MTLTAEDVETNILNQTLIPQSLTLADLIQIVLQVIIIQRIVRTLTIQVVRILDLVKVAMTQEEGLQGKDALVLKMQAITQGGIPTDVQENVQTEGIEEGTPSKYNFLRGSIQMI